MRDIWQAVSERQSKHWSNPDGLYLPGRAFIACEPHKFSHRLHAHVILSGGVKYRVPLRNALNERFGRSDVDPVRSKEDVSGYCSKYVTKWGDGDNYDFFGKW